MLKIILITIVILGSFAAGFAQDGSETRIILKAGTEILVKLETTIDAEEANPGDNVSFKLTGDVVGDNKTFTAGTEAFGRIISVVKYTAGSKTSKVGLRFDFINENEDFFMLIAEVLSITNVTDKIEIDVSDTIDGNTTLSVQRKNLLIATGTVFRIKLVRDVVAN